MRNLFALLIVAAAFTFTSCEKKGEQAGNADTTATMADTSAAPATDMAPQQPADTSAAMSTDTAATSTAPATEEHAH